MKKLVYLFSMLLLIGMLVLLPSMIVEFTKTDQNKVVPRELKFGQDNVRRCPKTPTGCAVYT